MFTYVPNYTIQKQAGLNLLLRKLAPLERHYYNSDQYLYDGTFFWLVLDSSMNEQEARVKLQKLEDGAKRYAESENP
ncbi:hypothetical protein [Marasmitruncus massiliensis]|uniref:hypothetical protein n=1 Tax=Marasmitruncus massiliensis TaxID=1944642 RepID=UPI000C7BC3E2|nr:hypothetical protein [Marasmitruncus massiliensis]